MKTKTNKTLNLLALFLTAIFFVSASYAKENINKKQQVQKYRVTQISEQDVKLGDTSLNAILQSDKMQRLLNDENFLEVMASEDYRIDYPTVGKVDYPTLKRVDYPTVGKVDYPTLKRISYPSVRKVDYPTLKRISYPSVRKVDYPTLKRISYPKVSKVDYPTLMRISFPKAR